MRMPIVPIFIYLKNKCKNGRIQTDKQLESNLEIKTVTICNTVADYATALAQVKT